MEQINDFKKWFESKLIVAGYPVTGEIEKGKYSHCNVFVNVSDEFHLDYAMWIQKQGKQSYWFPMGEDAKDMGLVSIFGALQVLYYTWQKDFDVMLHCHAGINRSQTVRACMYYMMTGEHYDRHADEPNASRFLVKPNIMVVYNAGKHLPHLRYMEEWLKACKTAFDSPEKFLGGMYDWTLRTAEKQLETNEIQPEKT